MPLDYDPEHGDLHELIGWLEAAHAERITGELRALKVPAVMQKQLYLEVDPVTGKSVEMEADSFRVLVPAAFLQISQEVMDVTHSKPEGDATTEEILADLENPEVVAEKTPPGSLWRIFLRVDWLFTSYVRVMLILGVLLILWALVYGLFY